MIYEVRTYTLKPGSVAKFEENFAAALPHREKYSKLGAFWHTEIGPLISASEVTRVHEWVEEAVAAGAQLVCGGAPLDHQCYQPTVLLNPPDNCTISTSEVFGPVVCVYTFDDVTDALDRANALDVSFQAAAFTQDIDKAMRIFKGCGTVMLRSQVGANIVDIASEIDFRFQTLLISVLRNKAMLNVAG